ncbi:type I-C CRISPR-associated protein Cas8c/Csd1 [Sphaerospermopsis sp. FACHB-1094]|uniref:type I-C CRISPR-associated protein Cas8c/Csd1 n=1 Tax=Sphaerospermopsis sp. FACHB-1094 TaxID=2692861 RepID=UPI001683BC2D|nr:type I-C CRISPR-associated protein Cas8c/Csd1 [Sphaerospermopsis sp. FACHB-1094]MBD2134480.1 type I-C CRISPR-associated protein Cas8c/Csd1 [Sphaerospermopsis sp. FACHB-1094]
MLQELNQLGIALEQDSQLTSIGFSECLCHWQINLPLGSFQVLETAATKGKPKFGRKILVPDLRRNGDEPLLIDDGGEYVFGAGDRGGKRHQMYLQLLERCLQETNHEAVKAVYEFITNTTVEQITTKLTEIYPPAANTAANTDWYRDRFVFLFEGKQITKIPIVQKWWVNYYASKQDTVNGVCLLTGEQTLIMKQKMPMMVKGVPGAATSGAAISSFQEDAYKSHGWYRNINAPIGFESAVRYHKALDFLLNSDTNRYKLGEQVFVYWGEEDGEGINPEIWENPAFESIFASPHSPKKFNLEDIKSSKFYLAILKGNKGRISVSGWSEVTTHKIKDSIGQFIQCQQVNDLSPSPMWMLCNSAFFNPSKEHTDRIATALIKAAFLGEALPDEYAYRIIDRICSEKVFHDFPSKSKQSRYFPRLQGLLLYLATNNMKYPTGDPKFDTAYTLGRIAFLMHQSQVKAQNMSEDNTNVMRSLKTLSSTPTQVFARLCHGCTHYHIESDNSKYIKKLLAEEFENFDISILPEVLDLKSQALFFQGWWQKRAEFFKSKEKSE